MGSLRKRSAQRGQSVVLLTLSVVGLLSMGGLAVDVGRAYSERRQAQTVADLAVAAGAHEQSRQGSKAAFDTVVQSYAAKNGFSSAKGDVVLTNNPPTSGPYAGDPNAYEVIVRRPVATTLLRVLGRSSTTVQGRAVALMQKSGIGILLLDPDKAAAFDMNKKSSLKLSSGTLHVNSKDKEAIKLKDNSQLKMKQAATVVGGYKADGSSSIVPPPDTNAEKVNDPLAGLPVPSLAALPVRHGSEKSPSKLEPASGQVLCPGVYYGGIMIDKERDVTFDPCGMSPSDCVFAIVGKDGLHVHKSDLTAQGVMIYLAGLKKEECGRLHFDDKSTVELTAPTSGTYEGLTVFMDRACTKGTKLDISGTALAGLRGEVYAPTAEVKLRGDKKKGVKTTDVQASFIAKTMKVGNHLTVDEDYVDEADEMFGDGDDPGVTLRSSVGASTRRVVLVE
jgi:Flp pilus assembly protein TadG